MNSVVKTNIRIGLGQIRLEVGVDDKTMSGNISRMRQMYAKASRENCDVVLFPELAITGYSPEDLLLRIDSQASFTKVANEFRDEILSLENGPVIIFGSPRIIFRNSDGEFAQKVESASTLVLEDSTLVNGVLAVDPKTKLSREIYKMHLPNWGIFDEARIFAHASQVAPTFEIAGIKSGVVVCRDIWIESSVETLANQGAKIIFVPNASPYANSRSEERTKVIRHYSQKYGVVIVYVNMVEGCDELIFDGGSYIVDEKSEIVLETKRFVEDFAFVDLEIDTSKNIRKASSKQDNEQVDLSGSIGHDIFDPQEVYKAIVLGTKEFINAIGADTKVCVGLSGGIDSALVASIAVDALGVDRVHGVLMPSKFTSDRSIEDANLLVNSLGITAETISIERLHDVASDEFSLDSLPGIVSENIQSRLRGMSLMMFSNANGHLVLATGNKSEGAVGYTTLYGDTIGAWAPIKDVYKTQVYQICNWRNSTSEFELTAPIPESIIDREPTAELRHGQSDVDSLYPYDVLDGILELFIDHEFTVESLVARGFEREIVEHVIRLVKANEFKRKQSPVGPRLTRKNFGRGRRVPICAHW